MELTETQYRKLRAAALGVGVDVTDREPTLTRDTVQDFRDAQGAPTDMGNGFHYWPRTRLPVGSLLVFDAGEFRAAYFQRAG